MNAQTKVANPAQRPFGHAATRDEAWKPSSASIIIGKDVLELLSTSMYVDPMTIYREYVQNAADAIDKARQAGLLGTSDKGAISIDIDPVLRRIRIRDNGTGIKASAFANQLTAVGASSKRGTEARGFRGVGRLAGLGYAQELIFRSRVEGETRVSEMRWDCRRLLAALRESDFKGGLIEIIQEIVAVRRISADDYPERFFEVELNGVIRHKNDRLLSAPAVSQYLAQVGPVPFAPEFRFGPAIIEALKTHGSYSDVRIDVTGLESPVYRPHRDSFDISDVAKDEFTELEILSIPGADGATAAVAWILHHGYTGAIPHAALIKGLRLRSGNIQVGESTLLEDLFPETRFNGWSVGEVHIFDRRIVPNGRRDHFQANVHFNNVVNNLGPAARDIARRCRTNSVRRNWLRQFELQRTTVKEKIGILDQGAVGARERVNVERAARVSLAAMEKIAAKDGIDEGGRLKSIVVADEKKLTKALTKGTVAASLASLPPAKRKMYEHLFDLVYECSTNRSAAKALIDRILLKIV